MFVIRNEAMALIQKLVRLAPTTDTRQMTKSKCDCIETSTFDACLPVVSFLLEKAPHSHLAVSPTVNVRSVDPSGFIVVQKGQCRTFVEATLDDEKDNKTFATRNLVFSPHKIVPMSGTGLPLTSMVRGFCQLEDRPLMSTTSVSVPDAFAEAMTKNEFWALMVLFNCSVHVSESVQNWQDLLGVTQPTTSNASSVQFVSKHGFPDGLVDPELRHETDMRRVHQFASMATDTRSCSPEVQHRSVSCSRTKCGFPLLGHAPLRLEMTDEESDLSVGDRQHLSEQLCTVPAGSTVNALLGCTAIHSWTVTLTKAMASHLTNGARCHAVVVLFVGLNALTMFHSAVLLVVNPKASNDIPGAQSLRDAETIGECIEPKNVEEHHFRDNFGGGSAQKGLNCVCSGCIPLGF